MQNTFFHRVNRQSPTRFWINNVTREEAKKSIEYGATGCTQNPSYTHKMLTSADNTEQEYGHTLMKKYLSETKDDNEVQIKLQKELVKEIASIFNPMYEQSNGRYGSVSIQGDPLDEEEARIIEFAQFHRDATTPNITAKVPATANGLRAGKKLLSQNIPVNFTEVFALSQVKQICSVVRELEDTQRELTHVYVSHIAGIYDEYIQKWITSNDVNLSSEDLHYQGGVIIAKKVHDYIQVHAPHIELVGGGVRDTYHFTDMIGGKISITINWVGTADKLIEANPLVVDHFNRPINSLVLDELIEKVPVFKEGYFVGELDEEDYESFGPVELFRSKFSESWIKAKEIIKAAR